MNKSTESGQSTNRILPGVQCFSWNANGSLMAVCPTNNEIWIFETAGSPDISKWTRVNVLKEHFNVISSLDWHPVTNLLLSASTDRGVIVWEQGKSDKKNEFHPQMGMIKESKSNLDAKWNMRGDKFCVGASSGNVFVGTFSKENNFWVAHPVSKKPLHKASVVQVVFDSLSSRVVASCSLDGTCQITSCFEEELDKSSTSGPFGSVSSYGDTLLSVSCNGWINFVSFSPNCNTICYGTHDCELNFADVSDVATSAGKSKPKADKLMLKGNPLLSGIFISDDKIVGTGFDKVPYLFKKTGSEWKMDKILDEGISKTRKAKITGNSFLDKKVYFNSDIKLSSTVEMKESDTKHANYINCLQVFAQSEGKPLILSTSDVNGYLNWWDVQAL